MTIFIIYKMKPLQFYKDFLFSNEGNFSALIILTNKTVHLFVKGVAFILWKKGITWKIYFTIILFSKEANFDK